MTTQLGTENPFGECGGATREPSTTAIAPRRHRALLAWVAAAALLGGACSSGGNRPGPGADSGVPPDSGGRHDSGPTLESVLGDDVTAADPPPAISGGTLLVTHDEALAIVADPDRDRIVVVDLASHSVLGEVALGADDEPGRLVEDAAGHVHAVLRRGGAVVSFDPTTQAILERRAVCTLPRGIAYDAVPDVLHVACASGEPVSLPGSGGAATRTLHLDRDLRDVVVDGDLLYVSRFRAADVLVVDAAGAVVSRVAAPSARDATGQLTSPSVAWRMIPNPAGGVYVLHQRGREAPIVTSEPSGYGSTNACGTGDSIVQTAITPIALGVEPPATRDLGCVVLGVDAALSPDGESLLVAAAGNAPLQAQSQLQRFGTLAATTPSTADTPRTQGVPYDAGPGRIVAVAYGSTRTIFAQTREPALLVVRPSAGGEHVIELGGESRWDTGHTIFHSASAGGLACASCHPEGHDDGRVWRFQGIGPRRTQALGGGILGTEPFHWSGDMPTFDHLMTDVFGARMSGGALSPGRVAAIAHWVDAQPTLPLPPPADAAAVERGRVLFEDEVVGCADCHTGPRMTTSETVDVGTGGLFQVPSLNGVAWRAPYLHDGCAATLRDRFGTCGGGERHGRIEGLDEAAIGDLVAYLETL